MKKCAWCQSVDVSEKEAETKLLDETIVSLLYSTCNECSREFVPKHQIMENDIRVKKARAKNVRKFT